MQSTSQPLITLQFAAARRPCRRWGCALLAVLVLLSTGCRPGREFYFKESGDLTYYRDYATTIEYPVETEGPPTIETLPPRTLWNHEPAEYWELTLEEAVQVALANSQVVRDLGGRVVSTPDRVATTYDPAIQETNPLYGVESALSEFDPVFASSIFWQKNDRVFNNSLLGGGVNLFQQDRSQYTSEIRKRTAVGSQLSVRHNVDYDANNATFNLFPSAYNTNIEAEVRQPLLRGAGVQFNRIAGPDALPGFYFRNGVLLARIDNDISLADFEAGVRNLVNDVENAYWDLYLAYRNLDALVAARDSALETWRRVQELMARGAREGTAANEAQAAAQYFSLRAQVEDALSGRAGVGTRGGVGSRSGTLLAAGGLYTAESNLRLLMGMPENDGRMIRPRDEPTTARVLFDWEDVAAEALMRRVELRQQKWRVKRRELEVVAARNFILPRVDFVGLYRWRGFGDQLIDPDGDNPRFDNAFEDLTSGDFQEWQLGLQAEVPIGMRQGFASLRHAQMLLARERKVLEEQERQVGHDLSGALRELHRAFVVTQTLLNARERARDRVEATQREFDAGVAGATLDRVLAAQQAKAEADAAYFRSLIEYNLAIKAVHFEKGSLLDYNEVFLTEGPWPGKAYHDAMRRARQRSAARRIDYRLTQPPVISHGVYLQHMDNPPQEQTAVPEGAPPVDVPPVENLPPGETTTDPPSQTTTDLPQASEASRNRGSSRRRRPMPPSAVDQSAPVVRQASHLAPAVVSSPPPTSSEPRFLPVDASRPNLLRLPPVTDETPAGSQ